MADDRERQELLTPREVRALLKIGPDLLHDLVRRGDLPAIVLGKRHQRFRRDDVQNLIDQRRAQCGGKATRAFTKNSPAGLITRTSGSREFPEFVSRRKRPTPS